MSLEQLQKIVTKAAKALYDNEKFVLAGLAVRAHKVAEVFPTDQTVVSMANFLSKRAGTQDFITRSELKEVYNRLYTQNNKFAEHFSAELGAVSEEPKARVFKRDANEGTDLVQKAYEEMVDPILSNALASAFDKNIPLKAYSNKVAKKAEAMCAFELQTYKLPVKKIETVAGQSDLMICKATYETPKGNAFVLVPVEIKEEEALLPTVFLSTAGFLDLEEKALQDHVFKTAGQSYKVNVQEVLKAVASVKNGTVKPLNEVEQALMKVRASKETPVNFTVNAILQQSVEAPIKDIEEPLVKADPEVESFAKSLASSAGVAEFTLGKNAVEAGRNLIARSLKDWGYAPQVSVAKSDADTIFYAVAVDHRAGFTVPVKVVKGHSQAPKMIVTSSGVAEFSAEGISSVLASGESNSQMMAMASPLYALKASDLVEEVYQAMLDNNYIKAEEALTVLNNGNDSKAYQTAFEVYSAGLAGKLTKKSESSCKMPLKTAHSQYVVCGHTNLPLHKVYQDKYGDCQPLYRKAIDSSSAAKSIQSKIHYGDG